MMAVKLVARACKVNNKSQKKNNLAYKGLANEAIWQDGPFIARLQTNRHAGHLRRTAPSSDVMEALKG